MVKNEWPGEGYTHEGETYCCQGCAEGAGCTCTSVAQPGFSREGQKLTHCPKRRIKVGFIKFVVGLHPIAKDRSVA